MTDTTFTGERLHAGGDLFGVDLVRHRVAYRYAREQASGLVLELGSGSGYGAAELAGAGVRLVAIDRVRPDGTHRASGAHFVQGDLRALPLRAGRFDRVVSFQVIEHLEDPAPYAEAIADLVQADGLALITTPNRLTSDGENPFHVHEYVAEELAAVFDPHFHEVEILGITPTGAVAEYHEARLARIRRIVRLDPLGLRRKLPQGLIEWLFGRLAILVRLGLRRSGDIPEARLEDFVVGPADAGCLDLLVVCRRPRCASNGGRGS